MRKSCHLATTALAMLTLLGCATAKPVERAAKPTPVAPAAVAEPAAATPAVFTGLWYVSGVFPATAKHASAGDPHLGAALVIDPTEVSDVNGQRCLAPHFVTDKIDAGSIGLKAAPDGAWDRLLVSCDGKSFATYVLVPTKGGLMSTGASAPRRALLQQRPEALYLLEQATEILHRVPNELLEEPIAFKGEGVPVLEAAMPEPAAPKEEAPAVEKVAKNAPVELAPKIAPAPVVEGPVAAKPEKASAAPHVTPTDGAKIPAAGTAMHLASYKGESAAKRGWKILLGDNDELDPLSPLYVPVDVPGKGAIIRLYATGGDKAELTKICTALKAKKVYCTLNP